MNEPCSIEATPARDASMIEVGPWAWAATLSPALAASWTATRTSASVNCGVFGSLPIARNAPETISLNGYLGQLVAGANVLAVQGLNVSLGSSDLSLIVELRATDAPPFAPVDPTPRSAERSRSGSRPGASPAAQQAIRNGALTPRYVVRVSAASRHSVDRSGHAGLPSNRTTVAPTARPDTR